MEPHPRTARLPDPTATSAADAGPGPDSGRAPVDPSVAGTLLGGRYRIGECIGVGAMGVVWTAWDQRLARTVAVKQLVGSAASRHADPTDSAPSRLTRARTLREGRIAARVVHPRAIAVFDVVVPAGGRDAPWLVMEYLPSRSLAAVLAEHGPLEPGQVAHVGAQIADALAAVHAAGIVHGDVKPGNVLIGAGGVAKLTDFGVSRASWDTTATAGGTVAGTPGYVAPEVARGEDPSAASDVFSLGATLYAAVEGVLVCGDKPNHLAVLHAMAEGRLRPATRAGSLGRPLAAMLRVGAEHRPDMGGVRRALRARASDTPVPGADEVPDPVTPGPGTAGEPAAGAVELEATPSGPDETAAGVASPAEDDRDDGVEGSGGDGPVPAEPGEVAELVEGPPAVARPIRRRIDRSADRGAEPTRPSEPVDVPATRGRRTEEARRPGGGGRVLLVAAGAALALGLGAGLTVAGHGVIDRLSSDTTRHTAAPVAGPVPAAPGVASPPATAAPASPTTGELGADLSTDDVGRTVSDYYASLPTDVDTAWASLADNARDESGGYSGYTQFWRTISDVSADNVRVDGSTATAEITFVTVDGRTSHETYRFRVGRADDGHLQIESARRSSSSM